MTGGSATIHFHRYHFVARTTPADAILPYSPRGHLIENKFRSDINDSSRKQIRMGYVIIDQAFKLLGIDFE